MSEWLHEQGFKPYAAPYHETMPRAVKERLSRVYTPTALYIRTRADRIAVHEELDFVFEYELKTSRAAREGFCNVLIEAIPFCLHMVHSSMDIRCLYVYRNEYANPSPLEIGFWVPPARSPIPGMQILTTPRGREGEGGWCRAWFEQQLPAVPLCDRAGTGGSDDPYVRIPYSWAVEQRHWQTLVLGELAIEQRLSVPLQLQLQEASP